MILHCRGNVAFLPVSTHARGEKVLFCLSQLFVLLMITWCECATYLFF
jgi:hypothetical protein